LDDTQCPETFVTFEKQLAIIDICDTLELGDPIEDLGVATVLMMVGGQLVLLRPRKVRKSYHGYIQRLISSLVR